MQYDQENSPAEPAGYVALIGGKIFAYGDTTAECVAADVLAWV